MPDKAFRDEYVSFYLAQSEYHRKWANLVLKYVQTLLKDAPKRENAPQINFYRYEMKQEKS